MGLLLLSLATLSTGCTHSQVVTQTQYILPTVPAELLACAPAPVKGNVVTQKDVARLLANEKSAGQDCRRKLGSVKQILEDAAKNAGTHSSSP